MLEGLIISVESRGVKKFGWKVVGLFMAGSGEVSIDIFLLLHHETRRLTSTDW